MQEFFNGRPSLEEFVETYEKLMLKDLEKVKQDENFSQAEKDAHKTERELSFEVLEDLLGFSDNLSLEEFVKTYKGMISTDLHGFEEDHSGYEECFGFRDRTMFDDLGFKEFVEYCDAMAIDDLYDGMVPYGLNNVEQEDYSQVSKDIFNYERLIALGLSDRLLEDAKKN